MRPSIPVLLPLSHRAIDMVVFGWRGAGERVGWYWAVYGEEGVNERDRGWCSGRTFALVLFKTTKT